MSRERILAEQASCRGYLDGDGPDKAGAWAGLCDWLMEEALTHPEYSEFLKGKQLKAVPTGFDVPRATLNSSLFDFQTPATF